MTYIPTCAAFYEYRGERYRFRSGGTDYARIEVEGVPTLERSPEALEFGADPTDPWVMLPRSVFDALHKQVVWGRWHGAPVKVVSVVRSGLRRGLIDISYYGDFPDEAVAAGFSGDQYSGWSAVVPADEIEDIRVEITRQDLKGT